ncbi:flagellar biosynthesis protein [Thioclava sp. FR2]|uniref:FliH/SctL family protein n=1 Tax=Thioclava sp. FR2 TaxID=3445780 RepID=UPI003EBCDA78
MVLRLEVFETPTAVSDTVVLQSAEIEEARLQSYETGYSAGWEDALAATSAEEGKISAEFANNLQHMSFTYQEARAQLLRSIKPVLVEVTTKLLPEVAREAIAPVVLDALMPLIDETLDQPIQILINPESRPAVERLLTQAAGMTLEIEEEPTLGEGQVYVRLGKSELKIDLDGAAAEVIRAVHDFFDYSEREETHG